MYTTVAIGYPIHPNSNNNYYQNHEAAYIGEWCEEKIGEHFTEDAKYGSNYADNETRETCVSIFDFDQTELLDEILSKSMESTNDNSGCVYLDEFFDIDDIIFDPPIHASTANMNNIESPNDGNSDELKKNLSDEILLILEGKGSQQMVGARKANEIEIAMSSIMDADLSLSLEKFNSLYDQESTKSSLYKK